MSNENTEIQRAGEPAEKTKIIRVEQGGIQLSTIDDMWRTANMFVQSGMVQYKTPQEVVVVLQAGAEHGFRPWESLQHFHVINGRLGMDGSAMLSKMRSSPQTEYINIGYSGKPFEDEFQAVVKSKRKADPMEYVSSFSVADAKQAKLWGGGKDNWAKYPKDMLLWRAVARHARAFYSDIILARYTPEELEEVEPVPIRDFAHAQAAAAERVETEQGAIPIETKFEESAAPEKLSAEPEATPEEAEQRKAEAERQKAALAEADKKEKAKKKTTKKDKDETKPYVCDGCNRQLTGEEVKEDGKGLQCPKCLSRKIRRNSGTPDFMDVEE